MGYIATRTNDIETALHEFTHRVQSALPELDRLFQDLHERRTAGDPLKRLLDIYPQSLQSLALSLLCALRHAVLDRDMGVTQLPPDVTPSCPRISMNTVERY